MSPGALFRVVGCAQIVSAARVGLVWVCCGPTFTFSCGFALALDLVAALAVGVALDLAVNLSVDLAMDLAVDLALDLAVDLAVSAVMHLTMDLAGYAKLNWHTLENSMHQQASQWICANRFFSVTSVHHMVSSVWSC